MTAIELIDFVRTFMKVDAPSMAFPPAGHVLDLLNQAQDEASAELGMPTKYITVSNQSAPFDLPSDARDNDPLLEVRYAPNDSETVLLPIYSIQKAGVEFPNWMQDTTADDPRICIFSPGTDSISEVYPYPDPGTADYFILYKVKPADMDSLDDEPFNGELERFHVALSHYVAYMLDGSDQRFAVYRNFIGQASGPRNRGPSVRRNAAYDMRGRYYN